MNGIRKSPKPHHRVHPRYNGSHTPTRVVWESCRTTQTCPTVLTKPHSRSEQIPQLFFCARSMQKRLPLSPPVVRLTDSLACACAPGDRQFFTHSFTDQRDSARRSLEEQSDHRCPLALASGGSRTLNCSAHTRRPVVALEPDTHNSISRRHAKRWVMPIPLHVCLSLLLMTLRPAVSCR